MTHQLNTHIPMWTIYNYIIYNTKKLNLGLFSAELCLISSYNHKFKSKHLTRTKHGIKWGKSNYKDNKYNGDFGGFALVIIYMTVTHTFLTFLNLKGGLFF